MKKIKKDLGKAVESLKSVVKKATSQVKKITRRTQHVGLNSDIIKHKKFAQLGYVSLNDNGALRYKLCRCLFSLGI
jgi:hypothetical protein